MLENPNDFCRVGLSELVESATLRIPIRLLSRERNPSLMARHATPGASFTAIGEGTSNG